MRISDWSSDVCSSDLLSAVRNALLRSGPISLANIRSAEPGGTVVRIGRKNLVTARAAPWRENVRFMSLRVATSEEDVRSEEHTSELQSLMRTSYAVLCL